MIELSKTKLHTVFVPDRRFRAYDLGYKLGIKWVNTEFLGSEYREWIKYRDTAIRTWGYSSNRWMNQERRNVDINQTWNHTLFLRSDKDYTLLVLGLN
jgi:hypothetical protein